ncbi:hypothetical protein G5T42_07790 [Microbacterium sp. 4R-513]|uniref:hypothetical protein n=1 Tax=Microbacterium sp. 4R-513 TaxID=2567934 RepID=UPI0013E208F2|nr:hypothetical protein [Microbacterium sp. 4R-513]QIG39396.1 hypothetical protein G5T42_07790 [Microbacterium sp. 4R-513]
MRRKTEVGDVFIVPVGDGRAGVGQVVANYRSSALYFAILEDLVPVDATEAQAVKATGSPVVLLALSLDAKLHVGDWVTVGNAPVAAGMPLPAYKELVAVPDQFDVVDYSGNRRRRATPAEVELLSNRRVLAPILVEEALRALIGVGTWLDIFDDLRPHAGLTTADLFT